MFKYLFISVFFAVSAQAAPAVFNTQALKARFANPSLHDGPNCYNATLIALGYNTELMYSSGKELDFYLKNFCQEVSTTPEDAPNGVIMTYRNSDGTLSHVASLLGNGWVFEKNNFRGTNYSEHRPYSYPGHYLFQPYSKSIYASYQSIYKTAFFQCSSADEVQTALTTIRSRVWAIRLEEMRISLSEALAKKSIEELSMFMSETGFLYVVELQELLRTRTKNATEKEYLFVTAQSVYGQILYANESAQLFCGVCKSHDLEPLNNELVKTGEILKKYKPRKPKEEVAQ